MRSMRLEDYRTYLQGQGTLDEAIEQELAGLGLDIKGQVLESAVKGDTRCRFVFFLPNMV
jgi:hypothetical protein